MAPIRVAQIMGKMVGGGVESVVMNYYRHIDRERIQFDFFIDADSSLVPSCEIDSLGGQIIEVPPYQSQPANIQALEQIFRKGNWSIVHSHLNALSVFPLYAAKKANIPIRIAHSHSTWGAGEIKKNIAKAILKTQANRFPTHRMACTRHAGEWLFGRNSSFNVVYNAIDLPRFAFDALLRERIRHDLGIPDDAFVAGCIGRLTSQKNQSFLIRVFAQVLLNTRCAHLVLVGDGPDRLKLQKQIDSLGLQSNVHLIGQREDAGSLYSAFDLFCLPSTYEGLGMVAIEAQVNGLPCLLSSKVPDEAVLSTIAKRIPLTMEKWADEILSLQNTGAKRSPFVLDNDFSCYDIEVQAPRLVEQYEELVASV